jgi:hypothetical protein
MLLALLKGVGWRELMFLHRCQPTRLGLDESGGAWKTKTKTCFKTLSYSFLLSISIFFTRTGIEVEDSWTYQESFKKKNNANYSVTTSQPRELQRHIVAATRSTAMSRPRVAPQQREPQRHNNTSYTATITRAALQQHELQRHNTTTLRVVTLLWVATSERSKLQHDVCRIVSCHRRLTHAWHHWTFVWLPLDFHPMSVEFLSDFRSIFVRLSCVASCWSLAYVIANVTTGVIVLLSCTMLSYVLPSCALLSMTINKHCN